MRPRRVPSSADTGSPPGPSADARGYDSTTRTSRPAQKTRCERVPCAPAADQPDVLPDAASWPASGRPDAHVMRARRRRESPLDAPISQGSPSRTPTAPRGRQQSASCNKPWRQPGRQPGRQLGRQHLRAPGGKCEAPSGSHRGCQPSQHPWHGAPRGRQQSASCNKPLRQLGRQSGRQLGRQHVRAPDGNCEAPSGSHRGCQPSRHPKHDVHERDA